MVKAVCLFFLNLFKSLLTWFDESLFGKAFNKLCNFFIKEFSNSLVGKFFDKSKTDGVFKNSIFGKFMSIPSRLLLFLQNRYSDKLNSAIKTSTFCMAFDKWADISIRFYGILFLTFFTLMAAFRPTSKAGYIVLAVMIAACVLAILVNTSIRNLVCGSAVFMRVRNLFLDTIPREKDTFLCGRLQIIAAVALGVILSVMCLMYGLLLPFAALFGILGFAFFLRYLKLGVFLTVALSPILPTMVLVALSFLCAAVFCVHVILNKEFIFSKNAHNVFAVFFAVALIWGTVNSFAFKESLMQTLVHLSFIMFYFVLVNIIRKKEDWLALVKVFIFTAFAVSAYGIIQNFTGINSTESWVDEEMFREISVRVYSFFDNPNVLGEFLVMTVPICLALMWGKAKSTHKTIFAFILLSMAACMIFTWSRGAWLGVFLAVALFLVMMDRRWIFAGVLVILMLPLLMVLSGNTAILERLLSIGNTQDTSTAYRVSIWQASINLIRDFWISGIGIGSSAYRVIYPSYALSGANFALHSHNLYLQVLVEMGIIGAVSLFALIISFVKQVFSKAVVQSKKDEQCAKIIIALGAGLLGYLFQGLTDYVWYNYKILMIFWIIISLGISGVNLICSKEDAV